jgi:hypothetical protein
MHEVDDEQITRRVPQSSRMKQAWMTVVQLDGRLDAAMKRYQLAINLSTDDFLAIFCRSRLAAFGRLLPVNAIRGSLSHPSFDVSIQTLIS